MPYDILCSVVSKLVAKSHLWILSETNPELSKNTIIIWNFAKLYLEPARGLMWYQVCDSDPEREMSTNYSCVRWRILLPLLLHSLGWEDSNAWGLHTCTLARVHTVPLVSHGKFLCFSPLNITMRKQHCPNRAEGGQMYKIWCCETFAEDTQNLPRHDPVRLVLGALEEGGLDYMISRSWKSLSAPVILWVCELCSGKRIRIRK